MAIESKIRVMHVVAGLSLAGTEYNVIKLVNRLDRSRFIPSIVALEAKFGDARSHIAADIVAVELSKGYGFQARLIRQLAELFRQQHLDVVHAHNWTTFLYTVLAARLAAVPVIVHGEHGRETDAYAQRGKRLWACKFLASLCDHLTVVSPDILQILQNTWRVPRWKLSLLTNGVMLDRFMPLRNRGAAKRALGIIENTPTIGTVIGSIRPVKDLPTLFKAFALVRKKVPDAHLLVVGHASTMQEYEDLARDMAIAEAVRFLGKRSDIPQVMPAFDVYANSSIYEGMSNAILEAMACGVPVVATAVGGTPAIVSDGRNGFLIPPKAPEPMSEAISHLLLDPNKHEAISRAGRQHVEHHHNFHDTVSRHEALYLDLVDQKLGSPRSRQPKQMMKMVWGSTCDRFGALRWRGKIGKRPIYIINYHRVLHAHELPHYLFTPMALSVHVFERQMDFFRRRCHVLSLAECLNILQNDLPVPERAIVLTFDDGYKELYTAVRPILEKYHLPVTVFLPAGLIGEDTPLWFDAVGQRLQMADLRNLILGDDVPNDIMTLIQQMGSLPHDRRNLAARTAVKKIAQLRHDLRKAVVEEVMKLPVVTNGSPDNTLKLLEEKLDHAVEFFSYPWGCYNELVVNKVRQFGYRCAVALADAPSYPKEDLFKLKRLDAGFLALDHSFHEGTMAAELTGCSHWLRSFS